MNVIYTVTSIYLYEGFQGLSTERTRCVGWYKDLERAKDSVRRDVGGLCEAGYYNYIVIEESPEGIYGITSSERSWWFYHSDLKNCWVECEKPKQLTPVIGFGIG